MMMLLVLFLVDFTSFGEVFVGLRSEFLASCQAVLGDDIYSFFADDDGFSC